MFRSNGSSTSSINKGRDSWTISETENFEILGPGLDIFELCRNGQKQSVVRASLNEGRRQSMKSKDRGGGSHREEQTKTKITVVQEESQKKQP